LCISQFKKLERFIKKRREIVKRYNEAFRNMDEIITPYEKSDVKSSYHLYIIQLKLKKLKADRKMIFNAIRAENIGVHVHYIPLHLQPYYRDKYGYKEGCYPIAEEFYKKALTLPLFPKMNDEDINDVIKAVKKVTNYFKK
jgi:dTDP-4-amino-4,6-dideoxygalactose transaminase